MGKKRKVELDLDVERTMYSSFVTAANAVSQLYTQGVQQQRRVAAAASRATLEKVLNFVLREGGGAEQISKAALVQFLQHEYENADHQEATAPQLQMLMPFGTPGVAGAIDDGQEAQQPKQPNRQMSGGASPALRARPGAMDDQQQHLQHQQHLQQQQLHQQQLHQQHLQQQHSHVMSADAMQMQNAVMHMSTSPCFTGQAPGLPHTIFMPTGPGM